MRASITYTSLLDRQPSHSDPLRSAIADLRRVRRFGAVETTTGGIVAQQMQGIKEVKLEDDTATKVGWLTHLFVRVCWIHAYTTFAHVQLVVRTFTSMGRVIRASCNGMRLQTLG